MPPFVGVDATTTASRSPYFAHITEVVQNFGTSVERRALLSNLISYRTLLAGEGYVSGLQFVDGSFVEDIESVAKRPPSDIDVFSILNLPAKYLGAGPDILAEGEAFWRDRVANREHNKANLKLDTYALLVEQTALGDMLQQVMYWYSLFSHQRDTFAWKGFLAIVIDPGADKEAAKMLGGA
ncbi:hypothetical protein X753_21290 [Mesorhizobium sp. LNJC399B00]|uniref:DUF6932 family protein n=1 Tax=unclassified Mesorhizobium TaxID=325217 RepID=UPI0003CE6EA7|nr:MULTISPECIES: hypothetical protein [unclassified Mesorhizobium]ESY03578.1 hypothetical protein X753_21290 [Mesorhizobium sp. LNJC399B00]WJI68862.1 hypothetical protein NLY36_29495 [Mesorhizobium sp. C399B]